MNRRARRRSRQPLQHAPKQESYQLELSKRRRVRVVARKPPPVAPLDAITNWQAMKGVVRR